MKRTKIINTRIPDAILTADWHLREDQPVCRTDNFEEAQWNKVDEVSELQKEYQCPVIHAADLFNHWKPSPSLLSKAIKHLPDEFYTIYGNHDLPQHNLELADKCGINTLLAAGKIKVLNGCHWGQKPNATSMKIKGVDILVWHVMNYQGKLPWPGCTDPISAAVIRKYPQYDLILTGHNHKRFVEKHEGRLLVNPGSLTRQNADQMDFIPGVFFWYADTNEAVFYQLDYPEGVISRAHIEAVEERDNRIEAFISQLDGEWEAEMNFEQNLEKFFQANDIKQSVKEIIYNAIKS